jgi:hypothetical protein
MEQVAQNCSLLNLGDLDGPFWKDIPVARFEKLKQILMASANITWVTWAADRDNTDGAQTLGFFRSLRYELPEAQLQFMDLEAAEKADADFLAERTLRLEVTAQWKKKGTFDSKL